MVTFARAHLDTSLDRIKIASISMNVASMATYADRTADARIPLALSNVTAKMVSNMLVVSLVILVRISMSVHEHLACANIIVSTRGGVTSASVNLDSN